MGRWRPPYHRHSHRNLNRQLAAALHRGCTSKRQYPTWEAAEAALKRYVRDTGDAGMVVYACPYAVDREHFHLGHP